jgi:hypothetical protein
MRASMTEAACFEYVVHGVRIPCPPATLSNSAGTSSGHRLDAEPSVPTETDPLAMS